MTDTTTTIGTLVGQAIARDTLADGLPREWTGIDDQDADQFTAAGLVPGSSEWEQAEAEAQTAFEAAVLARNE